MLCGNPDANGYVRCAPYPGDDPPEETFSVGIGAGICVAVTVTLALAAYGLVHLLWVVWRLVGGP